MKTNLLSLILFLAIQSIVSAQTFNLVKEQANENYTVILFLLDYTGVIQWQSSQDSMSWVDIESANSDSLLIVVKEHLYYRAEVTVGICDPFYSDVAYIENGWDIDNDSDGFTENQGDCDDLDMVLLDSSGTELESDVLPDAQPILVYTPPSTDLFTIRVAMVSCSVEPCGYAVGIFQGEVGEQRIDACGLLFGGRSG